MKIRGFVATLFTLALAIVLQLSKPPTAAADSSVGYVTQVTTPKSGQVLYPGQHIRIDWVLTYLTDREFSACEMEVWLSLDGGRTFPMCITPILNPHTTYFDWTVPNTLNPWCQHFSTETTGLSRGSFGMVTSDNVKAGGALIRL